MTVFAAVAEEGGFSSAARRLHLSAPAVTRAIASLEERLGTQMLIRTTRSVKLNETGQNYLNKAQRVLAKLHSADKAAVKVNAQMNGKVKLSSPTVFGQHFIVPYVIEYLRQYPEAQTKCVFLERDVNLLEEGFDVGIRFGNLADSSMRATQVGVYSNVVCASPSYLAKYGMPKTPSELANHTLINFCSERSSNFWRFNENGTPVSIRIRPRANMTTIEEALAVAKSGLGLVQLPSFCVIDDINQSHLKIALREFELPPCPVHIVYPGSITPSATVRSFIDLLAKNLRSTSTLQSLDGKPNG